jgi:hypothetical protein
MVAVGTPLRPAAPLEAGGEPERWAGELTQGATRLRWWACG